MINNIQPIQKVDRTIMADQEVIPSEIAGPLPVGAHKQEELAKPLNQGLQDQNVIEIEKPEAPTYKQKNKEVIVGKKEKIPQQLPDHKKGETHLTKDSKGQLSDQIKRSARRGYGKK